MLSVIFVDDEINVLKALRRGLRHKAGEWNMVFANSGQEALREMMTQDFDVIVSDMKMPEMSGEELLAHVRDDYPHIARIVLSGHCNQATAFRLVGSEHLYLSKPCPVELLIKTIQNAAYTGKKAHVKNATNEELKEAIVGLSKALLMRADLEYDDLPEIVKMWLPDSYVNAFAPVVDTHEKFFARHTFEPTFQSEAEKQVEEYQKNGWVDYFEQK